MSDLSDSSTWRLTTPGGIPLRVVDRNGSFAEEGASAQETYIIKANKLTEFILESFPAPQELFGTVLYPEGRRMPGLGVLHTRRISWEALTPGVPIDPFATDPNAIDGTYKDEVKVTIEYGTSANNSAGASDPNNPLTFLEVTASAAAEWEYSPARGSNKWEGVTPAGTTLAEPDIEVVDRDIPVPMAVPEVEWSVRWSQIPFGFFNGTLMGRMRSKLGKVNSDVMPLFANAPAETIMFIGYTVQQQFTWRSGNAGQPPLILEMKFLERNFIAEDGVQVTHNHQYRPSGTPAGAGGPFATTNRTYPGWRRVLIEIPASTGTAYRKKFEQANLNQIFVT